MRSKPHLKSVQKFERKLKSLIKRNWSILLDERIKRINAVVRGWINYFRITDMKTTMSQIMLHLNRRIRCIIWKQWKVPRHRIKCLVKLNISLNDARKLAYSRKGYWNTSMNAIIHVAISNKRLRKKV